MFVCCKNIYERDTKSERSEKESEMWETTIWVKIERNSDKRGNYTYRPLFHVTIGWIKIKWEQISNAFDL